MKEGRVEKLPEAYGDLLFKSSPKIADLQKQLSDLETQAAELRVKFGPENPRLVETNEKIAAIKGQIDDSRKSLEERLKTMYERRCAIGMQRPRWAGKASYSTEPGRVQVIYHAALDTNRRSIGLSAEANRQTRGAPTTDKLRVIEPAQCRAYP